MDANYLFNDVELDSELKKPALIEGNHLSRSSFNKRALKETLIPHLPREYNDYNVSILGSRNVTQDIAN